MKTALGLFLGSLLAISLAGCDGDDGNSGGSGGTGGTAGSGGSTGGAGGTGGSTGGAGGTGGSMSSLSCADYCSSVQTACANDAGAMTFYQQYGDEASCMAVCATFPIGTEGQMDSNTLGCRTYHAGAAANGPGTHCPHAGPLGGGVCGTDECDNFCSIAIAVCGDHASKPYDGVDACKTACMAFADTATVPYATNVTDGDSLACRMYHLTVAAVSDANKDTHCAHIAAVSDTCK